MSVIKNTTRVTAPLSPVDTTDEYPTHDANYGKGGYMSVADTAARNAIPTLRRTEGMQVRLLSDESIWKLSGGVGNGNWTQVDTDDLPEGGTNLYYTEGRVTANPTVAGAQQTSEKGVANGYAGLDGGGKVPLGQLPNSVQGGVRVIGFWNADTNTPDLSSLTLDQGEAYQVSVAGSTSLNGESSWAVNDLAVWDDSLAGNYFKLDNTDDVKSVAGNGGAAKTGVVTLNTDDFDDSANTNKFYSETLFDASLATKDTDDLTEGVTNKYYSETLFDASLAGADTDALSEGVTNLYYTEARVTANTSVASNTTALGGLSFVALTQAAYDLLTPDANTIYFITD